MAIPAPRTTGHDGVPAEIACRLTPADIRALHEALHRPAWGARHWGRYESLRRILAGMSLTGFAVLLLKLFSLNKLGADAVGWDTVAGALLGGAVLGWWWYRRDASVPPPGSPVYLPYILSLDEAGFRVRGEGFDRHTGWERVRPLRQVGGCLLFASRFGDSQAVPRAAFPSPELADAFLARAVALRAAAVNPPARMPVERLRYRLDRDDVAAFFASKRERGGWRGALYWLLLLPAMYLLGLAVEGLDDGLWLLAVASGPGAVWLLARAILALDRRFAIARHPLPGGEIELQRWGDHVRMRADGRETVAPYEGMAGVAATDRHLFLVTAPDRAIVVPRQAFADRAAMRAFADAAERGMRDGVS